MTRASSTARVRIERVSPEGRAPAEDAVVAEEPMEIRVEPAGGRAASLAVTMRTPGSDFELAAGFLFTEGLLARREDIERIEYCADVPEQEFNVVTVALRKGVPWDASANLRNFYATSSCGVCGKSSLDSVRIRIPNPLEAGVPRIAPAVVRGLPDSLRGGQSLFERTGGLHAAGLFSPDGGLEGIREDVGRHNAVDKVIGERFLRGDVPLRGRVLGVSGRAGFEIVQKAAVAGIPVVVAVGAPSSLAVDLARDLGMTLVGFVRGGSFNVYTDSGRLTPG